jgi:protein O-GlcNAc transferase
MPPQRFGSPDVEPETVPSALRLGSNAYSGHAYAAAHVHFRAAVRIERAMGKRFSGWRNANFQLGSTDEAIDGLLTIVTNSRGDVRRLALGEVAKFIPGSPSCGNAEILKPRKAWARLERSYERATRFAPARRRSRGEKLRVGYVSAFFGSRNWMKQVWGAINEHDRSQLQVHLFWDMEKPSAASGYRQRAGDRVHDLNGLSNERAAKLVRDAQIDVLVDLNGYGFSSRVGMFCGGPPVQVS